MITKKAGTVLVNLENKKIALICRKDGKGFEFPKGHLEDGESLGECGVRETEEETGRKNHLIEENELDIIRYITSKGKDVELYMFLSVDDGPIDREIQEEDKEEWGWFALDEVLEKLEYRNWKEFWEKIKTKVIDLLGGENG